MLASCSRRRMLFGAVGLGVLAWAGPAESGSLRRLRVGELDLDRDRDRVWPANLVAAVQRMLKDRGFDPGPADGIHGPKTAAAIREFQASKAMEPDGLISEELVAELRLESNE